MLPSYETVSLFLYGISVVSLAAAIALLLDARRPGGCGCFPHASRHRGCPHSDLLDPTYPGEMLLSPHTQAVRRESAPPTTPTPTPTQSRGVLTMSRPV